MGILWGNNQVINKGALKMGEMKSIETLSGNESFPAYVAAPDGTAKAAIIVIQEIFGVNKGIKAKCDTWAKAGYLAVAPDLFWRVNDNTDLDADVDRKSTRLNSSHVRISYAVFCLKKKKKKRNEQKKRSNIR